MARSDQPPHSDPRHPDPAGAQELLLRARDHGGQQFARARATLEDLLLVGGGVSRKGLRDSGAPGDLTDMSRLGHLNT